MPKYTLVSSQEGDWIGLYRDGVLVHEGHSIPESEMCRYLGVEYESYEDHRVDLYGRCPNKLGAFPSGLEAEDEDIVRAAYDAYVTERDSL